MLSFVVMSISAVGSLIVGTFIFARSPRRNQNRVYGLLTLSFVALAITNYFSLQAGPHQLVWIRLVMMSVSFAAGCFYLLIKNLSSDTEHQRLNPADYFAIVTTLIMMFVDMTPLLFKGLTYTQNTVPIPNVGVVFFLTHVLATFAISIKKLIIGSFFQEDGAARKQFRILLLGTLPVAMWIFTGFYMPMVLEKSSLIVLSPVYILIFVCLVGYAIVKHKMYDIRFSVIRIIAYTLSLVLLAVMYVAPIIVGLVYIGQVKVTGLGFIFATLVMTAMAINYQRVKSWFDKVSSIFFYNGSYDASELLGRLNGMLATTVDITTILRQSSKIIRDAIKNDFCIFVINAPDNNVKPRFVGVNYNTNNFQPDIIGILENAFAISKKDIVVTDDIMGSNIETREQLRANNIAMCMKIQTVSKMLRSKNNETYIMLGYKKSGIVYNQQDVRVMGSIGSVLSIAIQNALHFEEIQQFNSTLQDRVEVATRKLKATNEKLKKMDETKDEFISMASHQLRTPLTSVKGYVSMVLDGDVGPITKSQRELLQQSFVSSERMASLISDLLNLSRINTGKFFIEPVPTDLRDIIIDEVSQLREMTAGKGVELLYDPPAKFPTLMLDENKMHQVVMNLVDNAMYYTPSGGTVRVTLTETPTAVEFRVIDTGIGVPREAERHLFSKMFRAENARRARPDGTGLGLFMVKKVIVAQNGSIIFETVEGKGSTFGFRFNKKDHAYLADDKSKILATK